MGLLEDLIREAADTKAINSITKEKARAATDVLLTAGGLISTISDAKASKNSDLIKVPNSSEYYHGKNYLEVQKELSAFGFTNISLLDKKTFLGRSGAVKEILINDKSYFNAGKRFMKNARIVIIYNR